MQLLPLLASWYDDHQVSQAGLLRVRYGGSSHRVVERRNADEQHRRQHCADPVGRRSHRAAMNGQILTGCGTHAGAEDHAHRLRLQLP